MSLLLLLKQTVVLMTSAGVLLSTNHALLSSKANAAEQVRLNYRIFRQSIAVEELSTFAKTGKLSTSMRSNLASSKQDPKVIRQYLTYPVGVDVVFLDRVLNSPVGNLILNQFSEVIHTPSRRANPQALRAALVTSASRDNAITLMEIIQNYPTSQVEVNGDRLEGVYRQFLRLTGRK